MVKNMEKDLEMGLGAIFSGLQSKIDKEAEQHPLFASVVKNMDDFKRAENFYLFHAYPLEKMLKRAVVIAKNLTGKESGEITCVYLHHDFFNAHLRQIFVELEGNSCCADKSKTVIQRFVNYKITGELMEWDNTNPKNFGLPKTGTQEDWYEFMEALIDLFYGRPKKYLVKLQYIYALAEENQKESK